MIKWEYKIFYPDPILRSYSNENQRDIVQKGDITRSKILNAWGNRGWELVSFSKDIAIFKRPKEISVSHANPKHIGKTLTPFYD